MGIITAQEIIDTAETELLDTGNVTWAEVELLTFLNDGLRVIARFNPEAYILTTAFVLIAGCKQSIPIAGTGLNKIYRNIGTDGSTPGRAIREVDMDLMDRVSPDWNTVTTSAVVKNYMYNNKNPTVFWVYPPQPASGFGYVEASYFAVPADIAIGVAITISDEYANAIRNYICMRAHMKETEKAQLNKVQGYLAIFNADLGSNFSVDDIKNENRVEKK